MHRSILRLLLLMLALGMVGPLQAAVRYLVTDTPELTPAQALQQLKARGMPVEEGGLSLGFSDRTVWILVPVEADRIPPSGEVLELDNPLLDHVAVWLDPARLRPDFITGDMHPFESRPLPSRNFAFPIEPGRVGEGGVLVRIQSTSSLRTGVQLLDREAWEAREQNERVMAAALYAVIVVLLVYNLLLYAATRDFSFLWYCLYLGSIGLSTATFTGLSLQFLWPEHPVFNNRVLPVLLDLNVLFSALFVLSFIPREILGRRLYRFWQVLGLVAWFLSLASSLLPYTLSIHLFTVIAALGLSGLVFSGFWSYQRGYYAARFFLLAMLTFLAFGSIRLLLAYGLVPVNLFSS